MIGKFLVAVANRVPGLATAASYIHYRTVQKGTYPYFRELFIANGKKSKYDSRLRSTIADRFDEIHQRVPCASTRTDGLILAEAMLSMDADGDILECGCYAGASSAKLSIIASILSKKLYIFDSFEGLPEGGERVVHSRKSSEDTPEEWSAGDYSLGLEGVRKNIETFGEISVCSFVKGWFNQTLNPSNLPKRIAAAFTDVDLYSSARDCLLGVWPRLSERGIFFSHDVAFIPVLQHLYDENLWLNELKSFPPIFFGAGFGICDRSTHLGYMVKGRNLSAEYLKNLTLTK